MKRFNPLLCEPQDFVAYYTQTLTTFLFMLI